MTSEDRRKRVDLLFNQIAFIAEARSDNHSLRDELIKPLVSELWAITQEQDRLGELDYKRRGESSR